MKVALFVLLSFLVIAPAYAGSGSHGGDAVECWAHGPTNPPFSGHYALDYIVTYNHADGNADIVPVATEEAAFTRIREVIRWKIPAWLQGWDEFHASILKAGVKGAPRQWTGGPGELIPLKDEGLVRYLPANCSAPIQTVVRQRLGQFTFYEYDAEKIRFLAQRPLQYSFLMVHEWLWDHMDNPVQVRQVNRLLHSREIESMTARQVTDYLSSIGVSIGTVRMDHYTQEVVSALSNPDVQSGDKLLKRIYSELGTTKDDRIEFGSSSVARELLQKVDQDSVIGLSGYGVVTPIVMAAALGNLFAYESILQLLQSEPKRVSEWTTVSAINVSLMAHKMQFAETLLRSSHWGATENGSSLIEVLSVAPEAAGLLVKTKQDQKLTAWNMAYVLAARANVSGFAGKLIASLASEGYDFGARLRESDHKMARSVVFCRPGIVSDFTYGVRETDLLLETALRGDVPSVRALLSSGVNPRRAYPVRDNSRFFGREQHELLSQILSRSLVETQNECRYTDTAEWKRNVGRILELL